MTNFESKLKEKIQSMDILNHEIFACSEVGKWSRAETLKELSSAEAEFRRVYVTTNSDSVDKDKLTHIALFEYHIDRNPREFIDIRALQAANAKILLLERENEKMKSSLLGLKDEWSMPVLKSERALMDTLTNLRSVKKKSCKPSQP